MCKVVLRIMHMREFVTTITLLSFANPRYVCIALPEKLFLSFVRRKVMSAMLVKAATSYVRGKASCLKQLICCELS